MQERRFFCLNTAAAHFFRREDMVVFEHCLLVLPMVLTVFDWPVFGVSTRIIAWSDKSTADGAGVREMEYVLFLAAAFSFRRREATMFLFWVTL